MQCALKIVNLVLFAQEKQLKHNFIEEITLQTTKSICLPIYEQKVEETEDTTTA
jgi:hypothetical protein